ncbi:hypothetical protein [Prevotella corporis]|uniref:hypothetical protein n=1 Tax=Prevotella corporis TaxID=28128 RepID=UPI0023653E52|nr:hypothetical protein [Prevotella corporis]
MQKGIIEPSARRQPHRRGRLVCGAKSTEAFPTHRATAHRTSANKGFQAIEQAAFMI